MEELDNTNISFDLPKNKSNVIKVIGVGGGGSNAINYMFQQGIVGVDFVVCNTDAQALEESPVPTKIQLGAALTEGLGAGANPEIGARAAEESVETLKSLLATQTKMVFITAGMGGGTGTGAAPILAKMAKEMDILTVGIVTMPFQFEGKLRLDQAQRGLDNIKAEVDSLIVINNNKLREVYGNLGFKAGFAKADEVLATAARGIAEVITHHYTQNIDLKDAKTVLTNSGTAIMGSAQATGDNRAQDAIITALDSPLLNDNKIKGCKNVLLLIVSGTEEITIDEIGEINDFIQEEAGFNANIIMGVGEDAALGTAIAVTVIATGFAADQQHEIVNTEAKKIIHNLEEDQIMEHELVSSKEVQGPPTVFSNDAMDTPLNGSFASEPEPTIHALESEELAPQDEAAEAITNLENTTTVSPLPTDETLALAEESNSTEITLEEEQVKEEQVEEEAQEEVFDEAYINNLDVVYEIIAAPEAVSELTEERIPFSLEDPHEFEAAPPEEITKVVDDQMENVPQQEFVINDLDEQVLDLDVIDPETISEEEEKQIELEFDLPLNTSKTSVEEDTSFEDAPPVITHHLDTVFEASEDVEFEVKAETKQEAEEETNRESSEASAEQAPPNPFEHSIRDTVRSENHKRMEQLKRFNYVFKSNLQKIEELERQPAYKRQGIDLEESPANNSSRMSIDRDTNEEIQLRSNNSFLHDNVD